MNKDEFFNQHKQLLQEWINKNIYYCADKAIEKLFVKDLITIDDIDNFFGPLNRFDFESDEAYKEARRNQEPEEKLSFSQLLYLKIFRFLDNEPQGVGKWMLISEEAYHYDRYGSIEF